jgi:mono/diheme cytochrome c family protein
LPRFGKSDAKELVEALGHPNGWWRDEAQKLLVLRKETNAIPLLKNLMKQAENGLARAHALWTLDGMGEWDESLVLSAIKDKNMEVRLAALRIAGERLLHREASDAFLNVMGQSLPDDDLDIAAQRLMSLSFYKKQTKAHVVRAGHIERVLNAAGKFIDKEIIAKAFMVALNSAEYIPALELLSKEARFQNLDQHPLPQYLAFACFTLADDEASFTALLDFAAQTQSGFRASLLKGFRLGTQGGRSVSRDLIRCKSKPSGLTLMEEAGVPEYSLAIIYDHITWQGDPKFKLRKALPPLSQAELARFNKGREIYQGLCGACHGSEGQGVEMPEPQDHMMLAPSLAGSPRVNDRNHRYFAEIILKGMTGPIDGVTYGGVMAPMESYDNEWISSVMTYVRRSWGNGGSPVKPDEIERVRGWNKRRNTAFTLAELNMPNAKKK